MEKRTSLSKATAWYTIGNLFVRSVSFILLPLYSNLINTSEFGDYALIMSLYAIISVLYYSGLQSALSKFYLEENDDYKRKKIFSTILNAITITGLFLTIIIFFAAGWISRILTNSLSYTELIRLIFVALFFESIAFIIIHLLRTQEFPRKVVIYSSFSAVFNFILNIYLVYYLREGIYGIILAQLITSVFLFVILLPVLRENYIRIFDSAQLKIIYVFALPLIMSGVLSYSVDVIDRFIIDHFLGISEVGIYSFSYRIALIMNVFVLSLRSAWTPYSIKLYNEGNYTAEFGKSFTKILSAGLLIFLVVSMFIDDLFNFHSGSFYLFDPAYRSGIKIIPVILISYLFSAIVTYYSVYPYITGKSIHFLMSDLTALIINIILNFILIPIYGIMGAAYATLFSYFGAAVYLLLISGKKIKIVYEPLKLLLSLFITFLIYTVSKMINIFSADIVLFIIALFMIYRLTGLKLRLFLKS
ncbi:MAG TPA: oligosaccharide flippase family protein [Ignavibacteriaceae bacterium]|nr:oligosaccharide flippase family protein [Ignavibacteriaceae bacterium]